MMSERGTLSTEEVTDRFKGGEDFLKSRHHCTTAQYNQGCSLWMPESLGYNLLHPIISDEKPEDMYNTF